ncbi:MAG: BrnT family toxin [bacterium]|nr:BrnT family toxin [bacterium]
MKIDYIVCPEHIEDKLESKHHVKVLEARQVLFSNPRIRFAEKGRTQGNDVYVAFGRTFAGRYLSVFFVYKPATATAIIISARDMSAKERKAYGRT